MNIISGTYPGTNIMDITGSQKFTKAVIWGYKSFVTGTPENNTANVYFGLETGALPIQVATGALVNWSPDPNQECIQNFFAKGATNDGFYMIIY